MGEPGFCMKCRTNIIVGEAHACRPLWNALRGWTLAAGATVSDAMLCALGHVIVWYLVWHYVLRLDLATVIGVGLRCASGACE